MVKLKSQQSRYTNYVTQKLHSCSMHIKVSCTKLEITENLKPIIKYNRSFYSIPTYTRLYTILCSYYFTSCCGCNCIHGMRYTANFNFLFVVSLLCEMNNGKIANYEPSHFCGNFTCLGKP